MKTWRRLLSSGFCLIILAATPLMAQDKPDQALIDQGRDLAIAADCAACHTNPQSRNKPFAGGYGIVSPLGTIYSTNITPSQQFGIGSYSLQDFSNALRHGVRKDGAHLYPAMPYDSFYLIRDDDIAALYAYFMHGVEAVDEPIAHTTSLDFPFNIRASMMVWNALFVGNKPFENDPQQSPAYNRGQYLVSALAHCGTCHTPRNILMSADNSQYLGGGYVGSWYAPNITSAPISGIGAWSEDDLVTYLRTGRLNGKAQAGGPMAEAVENSFQYMSEDDLQAIATYIKQTPPIENDKSGIAASDYGRPKSLEPEWRGHDLQTAHNTVVDGRALYSGYCASCHQPDGRGSENLLYPSLFHNSATGAKEPANLVAAIIFGIKRETQLDKPAIMPHFSDGSVIGVLDDGQVASVANYVLQNFGNAKVTVTPEYVAMIRAGGPQPFLARIQPLIVPAMIIGILLMVCLIYWLYVRRQYKKRRR